MVPMLASIDKTKSMVTRQPLMNTQKQLNSWWFLTGPWLLRFLHFVKALLYLYLVSLLAYPYIWSGEVSPRVRRSTDKSVGGLAALVIFILFLSRMKRWRLSSVFVCCFFCSPACQVKSNIIVLNERNPPNTKPMFPFSFPSNSFVFCCWLKTNKNLVINLINN